MPWWVEHSVMNGVLWQVLNAVGGRSRHRGRGVVLTKKESLIKVKQSINKDTNKGTNKLKPYLTLC